MAEYSELSNEAIFWEAFNERTDQRDFFYLGLEIVKRIELAKLDEFLPTDVKMGTKVADAMGKALQLALSNLDEAQFKKLS